MNWNCNAGIRRQNECCISALGEMIGANELRKGSIVIEYVIGSAR